MIKVGILTVSDSRTKEKDISGKVIEEILLKNGGFQIADYKLVPDDKEKIEEALVNYSDKLKPDLVLTTGGTGFGSRDVTPEATLNISEKEVCGIPELIRREGSKITDRAVLSRGVAGIRGRTLIINLPGSPKGAQESLGVILNILPHAVDMLKDVAHNDVK